MTVDEFRDLLDRFGGDLSRWPTSRVADASRLLAVSLEAQSCLDETVTMELALAESAREDTVPAGLAKRIFDAAFAEDEDIAPVSDRVSIPR